MLGPSRHSLARMHQRYKRQFHGTISVREIYDGHPRLLDSRLGS